MPGCHPFLRTCVIIGLVGVSHSAFAQDKVVLRRGTATGKITMSGFIEDYTGAEISIRLDPTDPPRKYPAADVIEIQTLQTEPHNQGLKHLAEGHVEEALRDLVTALKKETRGWVRREILAALVRAHLRRGDYAAAGSRFLALVRSDSASRHFRIIPLVWGPQETLAEARLEATGWLKSPLEPARLLGASLLYDDPELAKTARETLLELSSSPDERVRELAQFQFWRRDALAGTVGDLQLAQWHERIAALPEDLRAGPVYLLGRVYLARRDYELAAATLLWVPLVDDHDFRLAARACLEAGVALDKIGQRDEARTLFLEVVRRFAGTPFADEARGLLEKREQDAEPRPTKPGN